VVYGINPVSVSGMSAEKVILFSQDGGKVMNHGALIVLLLLPEWFCFHFLC
jgi:hypothetical protein